MNLFYMSLVGRRIAHQRFADSRELIRKKQVPIFEGLGQIRANRVFSPIRIEIRVIRVLSSLLYISGRSIRKKQIFSFFFSKRESTRREYSRFASESRIDSRESAH